MSNEKLLINDLKSNNSEVMSNKHIEEMAIKVICPKCGNCMTYKNYWSWIWHTPFHWFGKRRTRCTNCGEYSYVGREKVKNGGE